MNKQNKLALSLFNRSVFCKLRERLRAKNARGCLEVAEVSSWHLLRLPRGKRSRSNAAVPNRVNQDFHETFRGSRNGGVDAPGIQGPLLQTPFRHLLLYALPCLQ